MKAMLLTDLGKLLPNSAPLHLREIPDPVPGKGDLLVRISACGVCHTELDEIEGRTPPPRLPVIPGHQVVGRVVAFGDSVIGFTPGDRVGVAWIFSACGECAHCRSGHENLCSAFLATGRDVHGGYAQLMTVPALFAIRIPERFSDVQAAPLLCAGAIGYRSVRLAQLVDGERLGLAGFGASGHIVLKIVRAKYPLSPVYVFARSEHERAFALELGADWAGDFGTEPPHPLHTIIDTTPVWTPVLESLRALEAGGRLVINAIRKEPDDRQVLAEVDYARDLWMEKEIKSVANVTRNDVRELLELADAANLIPDTEQYPLESANTALRDLKQRRIRGAKVLIVP
jgi:propanol-preferring alcohol dehydrogenase